MKRRKILKIGALTGFAPFWPIIKSKACNTTNPECDPTTSDIQGPFYTPNAPDRMKIYPDGAPGTLLFLTGTVYYNDCETPLPDAVVDVWQADDGGAYDNSGFNYRGVTKTNAQGSYSIETILPGKYLNGAQFRPRHIHFKFQGANSPELTTQLYFEGDTSIPIDPWASDPTAAERIIPLTTDSDGYLHGVFDVSLDAAPIIDNTRDPKSNRSGIQNILPNPLREQGQVRFFIKDNHQVQVKISDVNGKVVQDSPAQNFIAGQHDLGVTHLDKNGLKLSNGIYVVQLFLDGKLTDAKRVVIL